MKRRTARPRCAQALQETAGHPGRYPITGGICGACAEEIASPGNGDCLARFLALLERPVLALQPEPRLVRASNRQALRLFGREASGVAGLRGGQVFGCVHAFTAEGCGRDPHCEECTVRNAVVETLRTGLSFRGLSTELEIRTAGGVRAHLLEVSTERVGSLALLQVERFEEKTASG